MGSVYYGRESNENKFLPLSGGTMTGDTSMGLWRLHGLAAPVDESGAVSKRYMDAQVEEKMENHYEQKYQLQFSGQWDYSSNGGVPLPARSSHAWIPAGPLRKNSMLRLVSHSFDWDTAIATGTNRTYTLKLVSRDSPAVIVKSYTVNIGTPVLSPNRNGAQVFFPDIDDILIKDIFPNDAQYPAIAWFEAWATGSSENRIAFALFESHV